MAHRHRPKNCRDQAYTGGATNQAAAGNITRTEYCSCGAERRVHINGKHVEHGEWVESEGSSSFSVLDAVDELLAEEGGLIGVLIEQLPPTCNACGVKQPHQVHRCLECYSLDLRQAVERKK